MLDRILNTFFKREDIGIDYLTRWTISHTFRLYVHRFRRSDIDVPHDHPWNYLSIILWGGYFEQTPDDPYFSWKPPGSILYHKAEWIHRVILKQDIEGFWPPVNAWTLVWLGCKRRKWGFYCPQGFVEASKYKSCSN